jgi:WD40 repeat protein
MGKAPKIGDTLKPSTGDEVLPLPPGASGRLGSPRMRVNGYVNRIQFAPKGNTLIAASSELRAWDPRTGKVVFRFGYPDNNSIDSGRLTSRDSLVLLVQSQSGGNYEFRHYAFGSGKLLAFSPPINMMNRSQHSAFSEDGTLMAAVTQQGLALYDTATGKVKWSESLSGENVGGCQISSDGTLVAIAIKGEIKLFSAANGKQTSALKVEILDRKGTGGFPIPVKRPPARRQREWIQDVVFSPDGRWLAAGIGEEADGVCCWELQTGRVRHTFSPAAKPIGFTPDGSELVTYQSGIATFWSLANGNLRRLEVPADDGLLLSPDGKMLAAATNDAVILIDSTTGKHVAHSSDPPGQAEVLTFRTPTRLVGRLNAWGGWVEWDTKAGTSKLIHSAAANGMTPVALSHDGKSALYRKQLEYQLLDIGTGRVLAMLKAEVESTRGADAAAMTPNGQTLLGWNGNLLVQHLDAKPRTIERETGGGPLAAIVVSPDSRLAAIAVNTNDGRGSVHLFDLATERFGRRLELGGDIGRVDFTPNGAWLAVAHDNQDVANAQFARIGRTAAVTVFDTATGKKVLSVPPGERSEHVIALSPDRRVLARMEGNNEIAIWEILAGSIRARLTLAESASAMAFSADCRTFAASVQGAPVFLWDLHGHKRPSAPEGAALDLAWRSLLKLDGPNTPVETAAAAATLNWGKLLYAKVSPSFAAIRLLAAHPEQSVPFLRDKVLPITPPDERKVAGLIADLDHSNFRQRERATRSLAELGERARGALQKAEAGTLTPEARERVERLLAGDEHVSPEMLRIIRAIEAMEVAGTPEAMKLLNHWAGGAAGAQFTVSAETAKQRLAARAPN